MKNCFLFFAFFLGLHGSSTLAQRQDEKFYKLEEGKEKDAYLRSFNKGSMSISGGYGKPYFATLFALVAIDGNPVPDKKIPGDTTTFHVKTIGTLGPAYLKAEYGLNKYLGLSVNVSAARLHSTGQVNIISASNGTNFLVFYDAVYSSVSILPKLNLHFLNRPKFDPYISTGVGYSFRKINVQASYKNIILPPLVHKFKFPFSYELTVGFKAYPSKNLFLYWEAGIAKSPIQLGVGYAL